MRRSSTNPRCPITRLALALLLCAAACPARASDHLDTPTVIADSAADIGDLFAWTSADGRRLELVLTIVGRRFSDRLGYVFHVDSGSQLGKTTVTTTILCRFDAAGSAQCWAGDADYLQGDVADPAGRQGRGGRFRVFAGLRDDPFFNNVKGARSALTMALATLHCGYELDAAGCPAFEAAISENVLDLWRHTDGGPAANFLAGWSTAALVVSVDLDLVAVGGKMLGVWGAVHKLDDAGTAPPRDGGKLPPRPRLGAQIDRAGRALAANALIGLRSPEAEGARRKEEYNAAGPADWPPFAADIQLSLPLYDALDGRCGDQWLAGRGTDAAARYGELATLLADDRLWIDSRWTACGRYLAVELAALGGVASAQGDCGGRTPNYDVTDVFRSLLGGGTERGVTDGVDRDDRTHSISVFPFLAAP